MNNINYPNIPRPPLALDHLSAKVLHNTPVIVKQNIFNNEPFIDIRYFFPQTDNFKNPVLDAQGRQQLIFSKKGICLRKKDIPNLIQTLQELMNQSGSS